MFSIFTYSEYRKLGFQKSEIFKHLSIEYRKLEFQKSKIFKHLSSGYRKLGFQKIRDFQTSLFSIFTYILYGKDGCLKILDFLKSKFSIFTTGEYRKHVFIKAGEKNQRYARNPCFRPGQLIRLI